MPLLLEDALEPLRGHAGFVRLVGPPGSGKSAALADLAARLPASAGVRLLDDPEPGELDEEESPDALVVYSSSEPRDVPHLAELHLVPWERDDWIEYLLAVHPQRCASVLSRIGQLDELDPLCGSPELWHHALDEMAESEDVDCVLCAMRRFFERAFPSQADLSVARNVSIDSVLAGAEPEEYASSHLGECERLLRHRASRLALAADLVAGDLRRARPCRYLANPVPEDLARAVSELVRCDEDALAQLGGILRGSDRTRHPSAASLLFACCPERLVELLLDASVPRPDLSHARLPGLDLEGCDLRGVRLHGADLRRARVRCDLGDADLEGAVLDDADLRGSSLVGACLAFVRARAACLRSVRATGASLHAATLTSADLHDACLRDADLRDADLANASLLGADLRDASLVGATIVRADLRGAYLQGARLDGLDLAGARLDGAIFQRAHLERCDLQAVSLEAPDFLDAHLAGTLLTQSEMPRARFKGADLRGARMAFVSWEGADLEGADLSHADFHMGSSRSGLVSGYPSQGTRTGFYTDEEGEQGFKAPEEVRKANLRNANLTGAIVEETDFYLVDLRGARYSAEQGLHFRRCGAIL